jgi:hypothetical protein
MRQVVGFEQLEVFPSPESDTETLSDGIYEVFCTIFASAVIVLYFVFLNRVRNKQMSVASVSSSRLVGARCSMRVQRWGVARSDPTRSRRPVSGLVSDLASSSRAL